ncbi:MAG: hypothetical protein ACR2HX_22350 [Pyrinomonadaceae bacterium]
MILSETYFPAKFFSAAAWPNGEELHMVINYVEEQSFKGGEKKPALFFGNEDKGLVLNKTNVATLERVFGRDANGWAGKEVVLYCGPNSFNGTDSLLLREYIKPKLRRPAPVQTEELELEEAPF